MMAQRVSTARVGVAPFLSTRMATPANRSASTGPAASASVRRNFKLRSSIDDPARQKGTRATSPAKECVPERARHSSTNIAMATHVANAVPWTRPTSWARMARDPAAASASPTGSRRADQSPSVPSPASEPQTNHQKASPDCSARTSAKMAHATQA